MKISVDVVCMHCGSKYKRVPLSERKNIKHVCPQFRDRTNDPVKPEITHHVPDRHPGGACNRCGGMNPDCKYCNGSGRYDPI